MVERVFQQPDRSGNHHGKARLDVPSGLSVDTRFGAGAYYPAPSNIEGEDDPCGSSFSEG